MRDLEVQMVTRVIREILAELVVALFGCLHLALLNLGEERKLILKECGASWTTCCRQVLEEEVEGPSRSQPSTSEVTAMSLSEEALALAEEVEVVPVVVL